MGRATFTPGPWTSARSVLNDLWTVYAGKMRNLAAVHDPYGPDDAVAEANARLMAAAPDLYATLKWFIDDIDGTRTKMVDFDANVARARAVLAKVSDTGH